MGTYYAPLAATGGTHQRSSYFRRSSGIGLHESVRNENSHQSDFVCQCSVRAAAAYHRLFANFMWDTPKYRLNVQRVSWWLRVVLVAIRNGCGAMAGSISHFLLLIGVIFSRSLAPAQSDNPYPTAAMRSFERAYQIVKENYAEPIDNEKAI